MLRNSMERQLTPLKCNLAVTKFFWLKLAEEHLKLYCLSIHLTMHTCMSAYCTVIAANL